jgi:predicted DNA-binding transcriptional regulator YafY
MKEKKETIFDNVFLPRRTFRSGETYFRTDDGDKNLTPSRQMASTPRERHGDMSKSTQITKYLWILDQLLSTMHGSSYDELMEAWRNSSANVTGDTIPKRTFKDYIDDIERIFDIDIECNLHDEYRYHIVNRQDIETDDVKNWMLSTFAVNNTLHDSKELRDRISFERIPSGNENLPTILRAMRDGYQIEISYETFYENGPREYQLAPYFLKVFKQRWYLVGLASPQNKQYIFALDRIRGLKPVDKKFTFPEGESVDNYFLYNYGVMFPPDFMKVEKVRIKAGDLNNKRKYLRTLPLHATQKEVERHSDYSIFEVEVYPTYDFIHEILSHGAELEVLSPDWVREECRRESEELFNLYNKK